jgi:hypothetical protein
VLAEIDEHLALEVFFQEFDLLYVLH